MAIGDPYVTRADFKTALDITSSDEDAWIDRCLKAAALAIERRSGWPTFWKTAVAETRQVDTLRQLVPVRQSGFNYTKLLLRSGVASRVGFSVSGYSTAVLLPEDSIDDGRPADAIRLPWGATPGSGGMLTITAVWGYPDVPADIIWAHQMQAHRLYRRKGSPEGIAGSAEWGLTRVPPLDPDVLSILKGGGYMRGGIG